MKIIINHGVVTSKYTTKSGTDQIEISEKTSKGTSKLLLGSKDIKLTDVPELVPVAVEAEVQGMEYKGNRYFSVLSINCKAL